MSDDQRPASTQRNVLGTELQPCSYDPMTGYYRTGCCENRGDDPGLHTVCCRLTDDDAYDYFFEVEEPLPPGLDYYINYRTISIEGTPLVSGVYEVTIYLYVEGPFDEDTVQLCENSIATTYAVIIE